MTPEPFGNPGLQRQDYPRPVDFGPMPNRVRPRCPDCNTAMAPVFRARERGEGYARLPDVFWCDTHGKLARGRRTVKFL